MKINFNYLKLQKSIWSEMEKMIINNNKNG